jgi:hypothetical protein
MGRLEFKWDPADQNDPGPCIRVAVMNSRDIIEGWRSLGLECPEPRAVTALIDTGASVTVISKTFAKYCKLFQTSEGSELSTLGATVLCGEHAGSISACLIGRDVLRNWHITFDGRAKRVTITD